jgi:hypothetical protein
MTALRLRRICCRVATSVIGKGLLDACAGALADGVAEVDPGFPVADRSTVEKIAGTEDFCWSLVVAYCGALDSFKSGLVPRASWAKYARALGFLVAPTLAAFSTGTP